jgi:EpsI family protein
MNRFDWKFLLVGVAMVAAAAAALALKPAGVQHAAANFDLERAIPSSFDHWVIDPSVVPIVPAPDVQAKLDQIYNQVVSRTYVNAQGERMMLTVAYGGDQSDALKAHRQEVCYAAQGFEIRSVMFDNLRLLGKSVPVTRVLAVRGPRSEPVTYWFTMGDRVVLGRLERLMVQLKFGLSGRIPDGILVRISSISSDPAQAFSGQEEFISALLGGMQQGDVSRLLGSADHCPWAKSCSG